MAHESLENAECQSVIYFIEIPNNQLMPNITYNVSESPLHFVHSPPRTETPTEAELDAGGLASVRAEDVTSRAAFDVLSPQEAHREIVYPPADLPSAMTSPQTYPTKELRFELDSYASGAGRMAPHLLDHMYSITCKSTHCSCGLCDETETEKGELPGAGEDEDESTDFAEEGLTRKRPQSLRHHEYDRGQRVDFKCCYCDYTATRRQHVKQHLATHLVDKPFKCKMCDYSASQKQSLVAHALRFHYKRKPYKCDQCDYSAFRKQHVVVHMGKHMKEKPYKCDDCDFQTSWKEYLSVHKKNLHPASKTFKPWCE